ncbi:uncharacterized protein LOC123703304 isoform X2 [Colias croceus]|uniref:uncharacterized protein LOC123703304 isoform X2 n=1 Tax=Colias crocea TaxID=72248 RepID=UPI001E27F021|nr:uncharacterized protein LOC123703304 isoform X2 [Colias croceus]
MTKILFCAFLLGLCVYVFADVNSEWAGDYDYNSYEYVPNEKEIGETSNKEIDEFRKEVEDSIAEAENDDYDIIDYQFEDNRSEADDKPNGDAADVKEPDVHFFSENTNSHEEKENGLSDEILKYDEKKEPEQDIIEETKAILNEDDGNDFEKIRPLSQDLPDIKDIVEETKKLLNETDDSFDSKANVKNVNENEVEKVAEDKSEKLVQSPDEFKSSLNELLDTLHQLDGDEKDDDYDYDSQFDYYPINDDKQDSDKPVEKPHDDEILIDEPSSVDSKTTQTPIFYLNDALPAAESNSSQAVETTVHTTLSEDIKTTETLELATGKDEKLTTQNVDQLKTETLTQKTIAQELTETTVTNENKNITNENIVAQSKPVNTVQIQLNVNENTKVVSPNYPNAYPTYQITDYIITGDGEGIEMNVTDFAINSFVGDYVLIIPGQTTKDSSDGILATYTLKSERRFRFTDVDRMFIRFEAMQGMQFQRGFSISLRMIMPRTDVVVDEDHEEEPVIKTSEDSFRVNLGGVSVNGFFAIEEDFRKLVADMATMYINAKGIDMGLNTTLEITQIKKTGICYQNWPGSEQCVEVTFAVPLQYVADDEEDLETRLTEQDLQDMWEMYSRVDPFAVRLEQLGVVEFTYPNERSVVTVWLVLAAGVVISMAMLAFALWRYSCFEEYTKMPSYSDTDSLNDKRVLDLYPTPHQTLPPLYTEDFNWADDKYDITKDHGYSNNSYLRDDMFDIDSDEDTLRTQNGRYTTDV